jgi:hypothetical protein
MYSSRMFNYTEKNYTTTKKRGFGFGLCLTKIQTLPIRQQVYILCGPYMAIVYLVNKP